MHKFRWSAVCAALLLPSLLAFPASATAQRQKISNDMNKCAAGSAGPAVLVEVVGFKAAKGRIRVQSYSATKKKWLKKGQWINRIDIPVALRGGKMRFCMPVPASGDYGIAVRHDLDGNGKSGWNDGGGFSNNPDISLTNLKPSVKKSRIAVGGGVRTITVVLNYRQGLSIEPWGKS
ncbi:MAG: DUF2141 domain-containing protein [Pseudomonadota bacterium]